MRALQIRECEVGRGFSVALMAGFFTSHHQEWSKAPHAINLPRGCRANGNNIQAHRAATRAIGTDRLAEDAKKTFGEVNKQLTAKEKVSRVFGRAIFVGKDAPVGETISANDIRIVRPGHGLTPKLLFQIVGHTSKKVLKRGEPMLWDDLA